MLQQTQVVTVVPYFERFIQAFPSVEALAAAAEEDILTLWSGLGYYRRARHLHLAAKVVSTELGGVFPHEVNALERLPGIGKYTARAIASIAFGEPVAVLDGNVSRVLARWVRLDELINSSAGEKRLWKLANDVLDPDDPSSHNQAMMELGALICTPTSPKCEACPVETRCEARKKGDWRDFPKKKAKKKPLPIFEVAAFARRGDGAFLMARRPETGLLASLWELPGGTRQEGAEHGLAQALSQRLGVSMELRRHRAKVRHVFSHRKLTLDIFDVQITGEPTARSFYQECRWVSEEGLRSLPISSLVRKVLVGLEVLDG
jgi:A/G-specific adenine glycosylase